MTTYTRASRSFLVFLAALSVAAFLSACDGSPSGGAGGAPVSAQNHFERLVSKQGLAAAFKKYGAQKAVFLPAGAAAVKGREAILRVLKNAGSVDVTLSTQMTHASRDDTLATVSGTYVTGASKRVGYGKFVAVWEKPGDSWKIVVFMLNGSPGPGF